MGGAYIYGLTHSLHGGTDIEHQILQGVMARNLRDRLLEPLS